jgi:hypothetical protein
MVTHNENLKSGTERSVTIKVTRSSGNNWSAYFRYINLFYKCSLQIYDTAQNYRIFHRMV